MNPIGNPHPDVPEYPRLSLSAQALQTLIHDWASQTFPDRTPPKAWMKLFEELGEVIKEPRDRLEWADVFIMLFDLASLHGVVVEEAVVDKLKINRERTWAETESGVYQHLHTPHPTSMDMFAQMAARRKDES